MFIKQFVGQENLQKANELFEKVRQSLIEMFQENTWIDKKLIPFLIEEVNEMKISMGIPDEYKNLKNIDKMYAKIGEDYKNQSYLTLVRNLLKMNSEETILRVARMEQITYAKSQPKGLSLMQTAHISHPGHRITYPASRLNVPIMHKSLPEWVNIGSIAFNMAHELGHAFDSNRFFKNKFQTNYNLSIDSTKTEFSKRLKCVEKQFDQFQFPDGTFSKGSRTIKEDISDKIGFDIAFRIFKKLESNSTFQQLPGLENFTPEQLFFQRLGQVWCTKKMTNEKIRSFGKDVHSAPKFRTNGMMQNSKDFSRAFGCELGSPMNPKIKCQIFDE
ncbi:unnamed protein product [Caenorhabditis angaria]|uniref:Peptidase M13 C-terminal domain-containing protein n=1 Tax=Caenorhabditis angaria TaxID=860376 RepID=A0A9P1N097_9PELO|nr:unnamed protein product [Caenorhabditis angaria]